MAARPPKRSTHRTDTPPPVTSDGASAARSQVITLLYHPLLHLFLVALMVGLAYSNSFHTPFVFDDFDCITNNVYIKSLDSFWSSVGALINPRRVIGFYTFALNYHVGGLDVVGYHWVNTIVHCVTAWLVYLLVRLTFRTPLFTASGSDDRWRYAPVWSALVAALLFAVHPIQIQAVTYIVQRFTSLMTLFYLAAVIAYIQARLIQERSGKPFDPRALLLGVVALVMALLAMKTKETAVTLPLAVVLYEVSFFPLGARKKQLMILIPMVLTLIIVPLSLMHTGKPLGQLLTDINDMTMATKEISRSSYLITQIAVLVTYLRLLILPINQNLDYDYPVYNTLLNGTILASLAVLLTIAGAAAYGYWRSGKRTDPQRDPLVRMASFGVAWFFLALVVESSVIPIPDVIFEHRLYLPLIGVVMTVVAGLLLVPRRISNSTLATGVGLIVVVLAIATWNRNHDWRDTISIWQDVTAKSPAKYRPHSNLGNAYNSEGMLDEAIKEYETALELRPDYAPAYVNLGTAYVGKEMYEQGIEQYRTAIKLKPDHANAYFNLGGVLHKLKRFDEARVNYLEAIRLKPRQPQAHNNLGVLHAIAGDRDRAVQEFQEALRQEPEYLEPGMNLSEIYLREQKTGEAKALLANLATLHPDNPRILFNQGLIAEMENNLPEAARLYEAAWQGNPNVPQIANNLAIVYCNQGQPNRAIPLFIELLKMTPDDPDVYFNLAKAYKLAGDHVQAERALDMYDQKKRAQ